MSTDKKFKALVSSEETNTLKRNKERIKNRAMLRESQAIALKVLDKLDQLGWTQKKLAEKLEVSPQQVSKIVSGKENLTIETQVKLQDVLDIPILASYLEKREKSQSKVFRSEEMSLAFCTFGQSVIHLDSNGFKEVKSSHKHTFNQSKREFLQFQPVTP